VNSGYYLPLSLVVDFFSNYRSCALNYAVTHAVVQTKRDIPEKKQPIKSHFKLRCSLLFLKASFTGILSFGYFCSLGFFCEISHEFFYRL
jgi:hypothetical protein